MAHELGHNMGVDHDRAHAYGSLNSGYAYGYGIPGKFADIMSDHYINAPTTAKFSNHNLVCDTNGDACGIAPGQPNAADAAQALNDNREAVAALMQPAWAVGCLFDWAARTYPALFAGGGATAVWQSTPVTSTNITYTYRYYAGTKAYLGVNSNNNHVYYAKEPTSSYPYLNLIDEGTLASWLPVAGCQ
jgi:hypothetical protein